MNRFLTTVAICHLVAASTAFASILPITQSEQSKLTPDEVLSDLIHGNKQYVKGNLTDENVIARMSASTKGQYPQAYILSCVDSRVPVEMIFNQGLGDIFVGRVAGNVENVDQLGSMEFAAKYAGVKLVMVLGHESCGAVKGACAGVEDGNLTLLLEKISPAIHKVDGFEPEDRSVENKKFVDQVIHHNVLRTVADIRERSNILSGLEEEGKIKILGAVYSLHNGEVSLIDG